MDRARLRLTRTLAFAVGRRARTSWQLRGVGAERVAASSLPQHAAVPAGMARRDSRRGGDSPGHDHLDRRNRLAQHFARGPHVLDLGPMASDRFRPDGRAVVARVVPDGRGTDRSRPRFRRLNAVGVPGPHARPRSARRPSPRPRQRGRTDRARRSAGSRAFRRRVRRGALAAPPRTGPP